MVDPRRITGYASEKVKPGTVLYWMGRDQRAGDNWALLYARQLAEEKQAPLLVVFTLAETFDNIRQYPFMLRGLKEVEKNLASLNIPFKILQGEPPSVLADFIREFKVSIVVTDFDPLRQKREWKKSLFEKTGTEFYTVDAHNIVPAFRASDKQEFAAYTLRPKINRVLGSYLVPYPELEPVGDNHGVPCEAIDWQLYERNPDIPDSGSSGRGGAKGKTQKNLPDPELDWFVPGEAAAQSVMNEFIYQKLDKYADFRNDPNASATSNLSPWLHFGHISAQRIALEVLKERPGDASTKDFLEELIIRRELSDNYCLYNTDYDNLKGIPAWARKTLDEHRRDEREYLYETSAFEKGLTHDPLWNAAQAEMVGSGKMHGYMRMYWAKKILEWSDTPEKAMETAVFLNDKYELDGMDPNGYTGCAWSIAGVHDRAWQERPVFGKIRYMNDKGCRRKFNVDDYIARWLGA
jgi:deoxyribodipyrimidine photo-lyase